MEVFLDGIAWLADGQNWQGPSGIPTRTWEHLQYSAISVLVALAIAVPVGLWVGHVGRGGVIAINLGNLGRAIPDLGIVLLMAVLIGFGVLPVIIALVALAIPPLLTNVYTGVRAVDHEVRDAAEGMGLTGWQVLRRVEIPMALPLVFAGIRTATVQVIATATISGVIGRVGGLGRYIFDGLALQDTPRVVGGAVLVALLAIAAEWLLGHVERSVTPAGARANGPG